MTYSPPTAEDLGLFLGLPEIDGNRADLLIEQATALALGLVSPLPDGASAVILAVAGRAYTNPTSASYQTIGPMSVQTTQPGGLYLSKADRAALKSMSGRGGAFTVDPTPATADPWASYPVGDADPLMEWEPGWGSV